MQKILLVGGLRVVVIGPMIEEHKVSAARFNES